MLLLVLVTSHRHAVKYTMCYFSTLIHSNTIIDGRKAITFYRWIDSTAVNLPKNLPYIQVQCSAIWQYKIQQSMCNIYLKLLCERANKNQKIKGARVCVVLIWIRTQIIIILTIVIFGGDAWVHFIFHLNSIQFYFWIKMVW